MSTTNGATGSERVSSCSGCRFFHRPSNAMQLGMGVSQGECRFFPPSLTTNTIPMPGRVAGQIGLQQVKATGFPVVEGDWFCWHGRSAIETPRPTLVPRS